MKQAWNEIIMHETLTSCIKKASNENETSFKREWNKHKKLRLCIKYASNVNIMLEQAWNINIILETLLKR